MTTQLMNHRGNITLSETKPANFIDSPVLNNNVKEPSIKSVQLMRPRLLSTFSIRTFSSHPRTKCQPTGLQVTSKGEFIILDHKEKVIKIFSKYGQVMEEFGKNLLKKPWNLLLQDESSEIIVSDPGDNTIKVFSKKGHFLREFSGAKHLQEPFGMTFNSNGEILVADKGANAFYIHDKDGFVLDCIKSSEDDNSLFDCAHYLAVNSNDCIIATDKLNHTVKAFSTKGDVIFTFTKESEGSSSTMVPQGVVVDRYGNILVADSHNACVKLLTPHGEFLQDLITKCEGLETPWALCIDKDDQLVITDTGSQEIKVFSYLE